MQKKRGREKKFKKGEKVNKDVKIKKLIRKCEKISKNLVKKNELSSGIKFRILRI